MLPLHIDRNGIAQAEFGRKPSIASANNSRNAAQFWATEVFELSYLSNIFAIKRGSCNKPIPEVEYVRQRIECFKNL